MRKFLKLLLVIQEKQKHNPLGHHHYTLIRVNPFNPISYLAIVLIFLIGIILFGFVGIWKEIDLRNPFKYK